MKKLLITPVLGVLLCSCIHQQKTEPIKLSPADAKDITIDTLCLIPLESSDNSMIYDISNLEITETRFIVHSRDLLRSYNRYSGKYTGDVCKRGSGESGFSYIGNVWLKGDTVNLFDTNKGTAMSFSPEGVYYGSSKPFGEKYKAGEKPRQYHELPGVGVFSVNISTDGTTTSNPRYSFYNKPGEKGRGIKGREVIEPIWLPDGVYADTANNRILAWEPLRDTIFEVTPQEVRPLYDVDFGEYKIPKSIINAEMKDKIDAFNDKKGTPYASLIRNLHVYNGYLLFTFTCSDGKAYLAQYHPENKKHSIYHITSPDGKYSQTGFFKIAADTAYIEIHNKNNELLNSFIYPLALNKLQ